jgi:microcystin degradation protein MlrC
MRVAIAGLHHETNTFSPVEADLDAFRRAGVLRGDEIVDRYAGSRATIAGFLAECDQGVDVVPLMHADLVPCGTITREAFETLLGELLDLLVERGQFDVVLLALHGAAVAAGHPDPDGELASRVRDTVGPDVTVGIALDLHGNVTERMIAAADVTVGYRENPHRDAAERGAECAALALACARGEVRPEQQLVRLPMVVPILGGWTAAGPMAEVMAAAREIARESSLLSYTVFHGFGYADVPEMGSSVLAVADGDRAAAGRAARALEAALWERREDLRGSALEPDAAVAEAGRRAARGAPVVILDVGDNVGGGAPGDSTVLAERARDQRIEGFVATFCDERAAARASAAGKGAELTLTLGATTPVSAGASLEVTARVSAITDGRFEDRNPTHGGFRYFDGGPTARLSSERGTEFVVSSRAVPSFSPEQLRAVGIEPRESQVIVAKGVVAPRAGYEPVAADFVLADTPGVTAAELAQLDYTQRSRPLWPFEPAAAPGCAYGR